LETVGFDPDTSNVPSIISARSFKSGLSTKDVTSIAERRGGKFWVTTQGGGLFDFDPEREPQFVSVPSPFQSMQNMVTDNAGNLWVVASGGLLHYDTQKNKWVRFDERDGIPQEGLNGSLFKDESGNIYAGGDGFFVHFDPIVQRENNEMPRTTITHFVVMDSPSDSLLRHEMIELPFDQNFISIEFASLCFSDAAAVTFQYKLEGLEGLDENWRDNGTSNTVSYSDLSPGSYTFRVRAFNNDGMADTNEAVLRIVIRPPYYLKWWFISIIGLIVAGILYSFFRYRNQQHQKLEGVRNKIARDLHDDLGSALGSISFFSETAKRTLREQNNGGTEKVLEKIGNTSREMIENMHDIVWAVNPDNDTFHHVIERMKNFAMDLASSSNVALHFSTDDGLGDVKLTMTERKNLFLIFKETLYNSVKYAACTEISVQLKKSSGHKATMIVSDNGGGFDVAQRFGKGNGLKNMKVRSLEINAKFEMVSAPGEGTQVRVEL